MGIPHETMVQIQHEGIHSVADVADFDKDSLQQLTDNLRKPGGRIPDPNPNAAEGASIPTPAFTYGAKSQKRLAVACNLIRYYQTVGRDLTAANIQWNQLMSNFEIQWKALKERKDEMTLRYSRSPRLNQSSNGLKLSKTSSTGLLRPG